MPGAGDTQGSHIRASDEDRNRVADELRAHCAAGRITIEELDERVGKAMNARTLGDLTELTHDLPAAMSAPPAGSGPLARTPTVEVAASSVGRGVRPFTMRIVVPAPPAHTRGVALNTIAPGLNSHGFEMWGQTSTQLDFRKEGNRVLGIILAVMFFPIGLIALRFTRRDERVTISLEPETANRTALIIHGTASRRVRQSFADLKFQ